MIDQGAIPDDDTDTGSAGNAQPMGESGAPDVNSALDTIDTILAYGRQKNGLGKGSDDTQVAGNIPARPAGPGGDQPDTNPFGTKTAPIPFGKRYAEGGAIGDDQQDYMPDAGEEKRIRKAISNPQTKTDADDDDNKAVVSTGLATDDDADDGKGKSYAAGGDVEDDSAVAPIPQEGDAAPVSAAIPTDAPNDAEASAYGGAPEQGDAEPVSAEIPSDKSFFDKASGTNGKQDPIRKIMRYISGADAAPPQASASLEQDVDPQGLLDPDTRKLLAVEQANTKYGKDAAWGVMQHYRQKYDAYRSFAGAALAGGGNKPPDLNSAVQAANQAFPNMLDGSSVKFAAGQNGVTVTVTKAGEQRPISQANLTIPQFNDLLRGKSGQYDNVIENGVSNVIGQVAKGQGTPLDQGGAQQAQGAPGGGGPNGGPVAQPQDVRRQPPQISQMPGQQFYNNQGRRPQQAQQPSDGGVAPRGEDQIRQQAQRIFPYVSQSQQREQWIASQMDTQQKAATDLIKARNPLGVAQIRGDATVDAADQRRQGLVGAAQERRAGYEGRTAAIERINTSKLASNETIARVRAASANGNANQKNASQIMQRAIQLGPMFDPNGPLAPAVKQAAQVLGIDLGAAGAPQASTPQAQTPQAQVAAPGTGGGDQNTRVINGVTYSKVPGGWKKVGPAQ